MKGQVDFPITLLLFSLMFISGILIPHKYMTYPVQKTIQTEQKHDNAQMALIVLLYSTHNGKTIQEIIGEHLILGQPSDLSFLNDKLDKLIEGKCYKLSTPSKILAENPGCNPTKYTKEVDIPLPYNSAKLYEKLILVIN